MSSYVKKVLAIGVVLILIASTATAVFALSSGPVDEDASTYSGTPTTTTNDDRLRVEAGTPNCGAAMSRYSYVKWDLNDVGSKTINTAWMTFGIQSVNMGSAVTGQQNLVLYRTTDNWTETTINWQNQPALGSVIQSIVLPSAAPGEVRFESPELITYLQQEAVGDKVASFALGMTGNCGESSVIIRLYSKDQTAGSTNPKPELQMRDPNAVEMSSASAERTSWPLYAGLAAVALVVVAGVMVSRRRTA